MTSSPWSKVIQVAASRAVTPVVMGFLLLLYVGIAFGSNEPLTTLMEFTRRNVLLLAVLSLIPLNLAARLCRETLLMLRRRKALAGNGDHGGAFDEEVALSAEAAFDDQDERLRTLGYATRLTETSLAAWRGLGLYPVRVLFLAGGLCLFCGILLSLTTRVTHREAVVEGEPLPGSGDVVRQILLKEERGLLLERSLEITVALERGGEKRFGLYPPSRHRGYFLYPRYLGIAPLVLFSAPDLPGAFEQYVILSIYPPGKEDSAQIPGSPYKVMFQMASDAAGDPYLTGRITLNFRVLKNDDQVYAGSAPVGGVAAGNGYRLAFPDFRRMVVTDLVHDPGVPLIWGAGIVYLLALLFWLPVRLWFPRQEILLVRTSEGLFACSRAEGGRRAHAGRFHEILDQLQPDKGMAP